MKASNNIYLKGIATQRLTTRPLQEADILEWAKFIAAPEAIQFMPLMKDASTSAEDKARGWIEKQMERYSDGRYGLHALIDKNTGTFIGQCGLLTQIVDDELLLEIGYHIFPKYWRQGYASEAAIGFKKYAFENDLAEEIVSIIHINNIASQAVATKNGMSNTKQTRYNNLDVYIFKIERREWLAQ